MLRGSGHAAGFTGVFACSCTTAGVRRAGRSQKLGSRGDGHTIPSPSFASALPRVGGAGAAAALAAVLVAALLAVNVFKEKGWYKRS